MRTYVIEPQLIFTDFLRRCLFGAGLDVVATSQVVDGKDIAAHAPAVLDSVRAALAARRVDLDFIRLDPTAFAACPNISLDYAVAERTSRAAVVPADLGWSDVGSWSALWELGTKDAHGNVQLSGTGALADLLCEEIKNKLGIKRVRGDTFGYLQRSFIGCVSDVDQREAREVGEKAVQYAMWGDRSGSVTIQRIGYYSVDYELAPLAAIAGKTRVMAARSCSATRPWGLQASWQRASSEQQSEQIGPV